MVWFECCADLYLYPISQEWQIYWQYQHRLGWGRLRKSAFLGGFDKNAIAPMLATRMHH